MIISIEMFRQECQPWKACNILHRSSPLILSIYPQNATFTCHTPHSKFKKIFLTSHYMLHVGKNEKRLHIREQPSSRGLFLCTCTITRLHLSHVVRECFTFVPIWIPFKLLPPLIWLNHLGMGMVLLELMNQVREIVLTMHCG